MNQEEYLVLYEKYLAGLCSAEEREKLYAYQDGFEMHGHDLSKVNEDDLQHKAQLFEKISHTIERSSKPFSPLYNYLKIAAIFVVTLGLGLLFINKKAFQSTAPALVQQGPKKTNSIKPGRNTATLTLSDGSVLDLERVENGMIASTQGSQVKKSAEGAIVYQSSGETSVPENLNTISVPAGGQYKVVLSDGTAVWLNALSKLTYPTIFNGKNREVVLSGEAYFEVAKNAARPFIARVNSMKVTVLGTHFNINSYDANSYKTTLLEGSVRISNSVQDVLLKPGQQGLLLPQRAGIEVSKVNLNKVVAWKNGYFMFQDDSIEDIMAQISRWYNVDVEFQGAMPVKTFGGIYSRDKDFNELLQGLELTGLVRFKVEGRRITVMR